jgi:hypothetical protein
VRERLGLLFCRVGNFEQQHFAVTHPKNLAQTKQNNHNNKSGKPKEFEKIDQIISDVNKQNH